MIRTSGRYSALPASVRSITVLRLSRYDRVGPPVQHEEVKGTLRTAKLEHTALLEKVRIDHTMTLKLKEAELSEAATVTYCGDPGIGERSNDDRLARILSA